MGFRQLCVLTAQLPPESRTVYRLREANEYGGSPDAPEWLVELNKLRGVRPDSIRHR